jgi:GT2 family glycosyltransferase
VASMVSEILKRDDVLAVDALQYDWDGQNEVHLATRLATNGSARTRSHELIPGLHMCHEHRDAPSAVLMASAANMLARKSMFRVLGGFDEKLFFGYEDVDLCWRGWMRGWNTVFVPAAKCWHRVSHSSHSTSASSLSFRGIETGRLVMATKLLPVKYAFLTWFVSLAGLARDLLLLRWRRVADRLQVLRQYLRYFLPLVRERWKIHRLAQTSPRAQLQRLLQLGSTGSSDSSDSSAALSGSVNVFSR